jgi:hypothetical protein
MGGGHQLEVVFDCAWTRNGDKIIAADREIENRDDCVSPMFALQNIWRVGESFLPTLAHLSRSIPGKRQCSAAVVSAPQSKD